MIRRIESEEDILACAAVMREAFGTVAAEFGLTERNAPSNPAFMNVEKLQNYLEKPVLLYGCFIEKRIVGCIAIEKSKSEEGTFHIERLCVIPGERHKGYGRVLLDFAVAAIREREGRTVTIGIINENHVLKDWYLEYGFRVVSHRRFEHLPFEVCFMAMEIPHS
jgi:diamine N-acetyltransferase